MALPAARQSCPNCSRSHDVSVYVSGQRVRCSCGLHFEVVRNDVRLPAAGRPPTAGAAAPSVLGTPEVRRAGGAAGITPRAGPTAAAPPESCSAVADAAGAMLGATAVLPASATGAAALGATAILPEGAAGAPAPGSGAAGAGATRVAPPPAIPGYDLLELIGRGGMGEVWKARQLSLGRLVAVKILSRELASDLDFIRRFEKEASALAALSHPNIVQIIDRGACDEGRIWFFAMEFCEGRPLRALLEERRLAPAQALRLLARVTRAIESAHRRGVIHRDLKPENVLVDEAGEPKVVDFGLAGLRQPAAVQLTRPATSMGTLHYMAPEQRRDARTADERADLYSLGVMIYEALVGDVPVGRFKLPSEKCPGLDGRLDKIVTKALQPEPEARYGTAGELAAELERVAEAAAEVRALRRVPSPQGDSWRRIGWIAATVAAAALLARFFLSGS